MGPFYSWLRHYCQGHHSEQQQGFLWPDLQCLGDLVDTRSSDGISIHRQSMECLPPLLPRQTGTKTWQIPPHVTARHTVANDAPSTVQGLMQYTSILASATSSTTNFVHCTLGLHSLVFCALDHRNLSCSAVSRCDFPVAAISFITSWPRHATAATSRSSKALGRGDHR